MTDILCFSGGLDSFIAYFYLRKPKTVFVDLRHKYAWKEDQIVCWFRDNLGIETIIDKRLRLDDLEKPDGEIPLRNMFLASIASLYGDKIWLSFQQGETKNPSNDRSPEFCTKVSDLLTHLHGKPVKVDSPFWDMTKIDIVKRYLDAGHPPGFLKKTISCFSGDIKIHHDKPVSYHCGDCSSCFRKAIALSNNGIVISDMFERDIKKYNKIPTYITRMKKGEYEKRRTEQTLETLQNWGWKID